MWSLLKNRSIKLNWRVYKTHFANINHHSDKSFTMNDFSTTSQKSILKWFIVIVLLQDSFAIYSVWCLPSVCVCLCVKAEVKTNEITRAGTTLGSFISANKPVLPNRLWSSKVKPDKPSQARWRERQLTFEMKGSAPRTLMYLTIYTVHACQNLLCGQTFQNHWMTGWLGQ